MASDIQANVTILIERKKQIENEISAMGAILAQNGIGMNDPLVDAEGFPLQNIDIYQVRHARHRIICLQNDHKAIMKHIENSLERYYLSSNNVSSQQTSTGETTPHVNYSEMEPFAKISGVVPGSPVDEAGLQNNDLIVEFGSVNAGNYKDVTTIADVVRHSENMHLPVRIRRGTRTIAAELRPRKWFGNGLLGCVITSLETIDR